MRGRRHDVTAQRMHWHDTANNTGIHSTTAFRHCDTQQIHQSDIDDNCDSRPLRTNGMSVPRVHSLAEKCMDRLADPYQTAQYWTSLIPLPKLVLDLSNERTEPSRAVRLEHVPRPFVRRLCRPVMLVSRNPGLLLAV